MSYEKISEYHQKLGQATRRREMWQRTIDNGFNSVDTEAYLKYWTAEENRWRAELERFTVIECDPATKVIGAPGLNIGLGVCITRGDRFLISKRLKACRIGVDRLAMPGGAFEYGESIVECMEREALEETGLEIIPVFDEAGDSPVFHVQENDREGMRIITLYTHARLKDPEAEPINPEPHKHTDWHWATLFEVQRTHSLDRSWIPIAAFQRNYRRLFLSSE
jgi:8-oxo-dGTP diphosphatase